MVCDKSGMKTDIWQTPYIKKKNIGVRSGELWGQCRNSSLSEPARTTHLFGSRSLGWLLTSLRNCGMDFCGLQMKLAWTHSNVSLLTDGALFLRFGILLTNCMPIEWICHKLGSEMLFHTNSRPERGNPGHKKLFWFWWQPFFSHIALVANSAYCAAVR